MHEISLLVASLAIILTMLFGREYRRKRTRIDLTLMLYGMVFTIRQIVLYTWLNLDPASPLYTPYRALDYIIGVPLMLLGFELFHSSAMARTHKISKWFRPVTNLTILFTLPLFGTLYFFLDGETARKIATIILGPILFLILCYYLLFFRKNPYRISKPEFERGINLILLGYIVLIVGAGIFAGAFRAIDVAIASELISLMIIGAGGAVSGVVTFAGLYAKLDISLIVVGKTGQIELVKFGDSIERINISRPSILQAKAILTYFADALENVFQTGIELTIPYTTLEPLDSEKLYRVSILPHQLDRQGSPFSLLIVITDVTSSVHEIESDELTQLFKEYLNERDTAQLYFDLLSHDVGNLLQAILFAVESADFGGGEYLTQDITQDLLAKVYRSLYLLKEVRLMAHLKSHEQPLSETNVVTLMQQAIKEVPNTVMNYSLKMQFNMPSSQVTPLVRANSALVHGFLGVFHFCATNHKGPEPVNISVAYSDDGNHIIIQVTDPTIEITEDTIPHTFSPYFRALIPIDSIGLIFAQRFILHYGGSIEIAQVETGMQLVIRLPAA